MVTGECSGKEDANCVFKDLKPLILERNCIFFSNHKGQSPQEKVETENSNTLFQKQLPFVLKDRMGGLERKLALF